MSKCSRLSVQCKCWLIGTNRYILNFFSSLNVSQCYAVTAPIAAENSVKFFKSLSISLQSPKTITTTTKPRNPSQTKILSIFEHSLLLFLSMAQQIFTLFQLTGGAAVGGREIVCRLKVSALL